MKLINKIQVFSVAFGMLTGASLFAQEGVSSASTSPQEGMVATVVKVKGKIQSDANNEGLPFSTAVLINKYSGAQYGISADEDGNLLWEAVPAGEYTVKAYYVGFDAYESEASISESSINFTLPTISLNPGKALSLKTVEILDFRDLIEDRPDGLVYNVEQDATNLGTTADEMLRKVPMVTVDLDGNVSLRGSQNIKVLIDNKPSTILAQSVADALKQLPSDQIKSVEVITSPGAKYDAEGTSGVINIITKKNIITGFNGMIHGGGSHTFGYDDVNGRIGTNLNFRRDKFGAAINFGIGNWNRYSDGFSERTDYPGTDSSEVMRQDFNTKMGGPFIWGGLNLDYQIDSLQTVFAGFNVSPGNYINETENRTQFDAYGIDYRRKVKDETPRMNYSFNTSYSKIFKDNPKKSLDVLALYSIGTSNNKYNLSQFSNSESTANYWERSVNDATNNELAAQVDYVHPFNNNKQKLEVGAKYVHRDVRSDYHLETADNEGQWQQNPNRTNALDYIQQVAAVYAQFTTPVVDKVDAIVGVRAEYTDIDATQRDFGGAFSDNYFNVLPSAILTYSLSDFNKLKLAYFPRIGRPSIEYINPYINYSDEFNLKQGNPELDPELSHNVELGYSGIFGRSSFNINAFYRFTNNAIEIVGNVEDGVSMSTYGNYAQNATTGVNMNISSRFFNKLMVSLNGDVYYKDIKSNSMDLENDGFEYKLHLFSSFQFGKGWSAEGFGMYNARTVMLQGVNSGYYFYSLGVKKSILQGKADVRVSVSNIFNPSVNYTMEHNYQNAHFYSESKNAARGIRLGFSYKFGKMTFTPRAKQIKSDDLLEGTDEGSQNQGMN